jgi:hypothetical protein
MVFDAVRLRDSRALPLSISMFVAYYAYRLLDMLVDTELIKESILKKIFSIHIENIDRGSSIPNTASIQI